MTTAKANITAIFFSDFKTLLIFILYYVLQVFHTLIRGNRQGCYELNLQLAIIVFQI